MIRRNLADQILNKIKCDKPLIAKLQVRTITAMNDTFQDNLKEILGNAKFNAEMIQQFFADEIANITIS